MDDAIKKANDAILERMQGMPAKTMTRLEAMMDPTNPHVFEANDNGEAAVSDLADQSGGSRFFPTDDYMRGWKAASDASQKRVAELEAGIRDAVSTLSLSSHPHCRDASIALEELVK